jgi:hypothetical protein
VPVIEAVPFLVLWFALSGAFGYVMARGRLPQLPWRRKPKFDFDDYGAMLLWREHCAKVKQMNAEFAEPLGWRLNHSNTELQFNVYASRSHSRASRYTHLTVDEGRERGHLGKYAWYLTCYDPESGPVNIGKAISIILSDGA